MDVTLHVVVYRRSGTKVAFDGLSPTGARTAERDGVRLTIGAATPAPVTVTPMDPGDPIARVEYSLYTPIRNYHRVIVPDSGRWFVFSLQPVSFWRFDVTSCINDVKTPLYLFTGQDMNTALAFGIVGLNYETRFRILEPYHNRALNSFMRRLSFQITRGTEDYPIPDAARAADGSVTEHLYVRTGADAPGRPWVWTLRDFYSNHKRLYGIPDIGHEAAMAPLWCSWTDWMSNDVTEAVVLRSVHEGVKLGIRNYIIDDGWFGPGLDNDWSVDLNIGDWEPEASRFPDMGRLVRDIRAAGAVPMIWCAPHAVARGARCFEARRRLLIVGKDGKPVVTTNGFHSLCFMNPEARRVMADIAASFIERWDMDGAKYDLFNCVPNERCVNPDHAHDVSSMVQGLELTLQEMAERCRALKPDYIIELKQNYGTPFLARYGSMTRAGDTPFSLDANFLRTLHVQAYSPFSINDYQTITDADSPEDAACVVIKMMSVGIPTYSMDFDRVTEANKRVMARYNGWYNANVRHFMKHREPLDGDANLFRLDAGDRDFVFLVNNGGPVTLRRATTILNGTHRRDLFLRGDALRQVTATSWDCLGREVATRRLDLSGWAHLAVLPGGMVDLAPANDLPSP
jgi:hypothetical protein